MLRMASAVRLQMVCELPAKLTLEPLELILPEEIVIAKVIAK